MMDINAFWRKVLEKDREALPLYFSNDAMIRWVCTNEQFTVSEYIKVNCDYPGEWDGSIERIEQNGNTFVIAGHVFPPDRSASYHVVSFLRMEDDKICEMDEYWADDGAAPEWHRKMKIGKPIID